MNNMNDSLPIKIESRIITLRDTPVIIDRDVAEIFDVTTKAINQAVRRNADKFPPSYRFALQSAEIQEVVTNCDRLTTLRNSPSSVYAFTEKGLYMLATILRSKRAVQITFEIIETFARVRQLQTTLLQLHTERNPERQKNKMALFSEALSAIVIPELRPEETENSIELNFLVGKLKHTVKRKRTNDGRADIVEEEPAPYGTFDEETNNQED